MAVEGVCCICGESAELSFEHVPPRAAFNDKRIFEADIDALLQGKWSPDERIEQGKYKQRGAGRYSLCGGCNNITGKWYGEGYVQVAKQAMILLHASKGTMSLAYPYMMYPLRFLKQIAVMFFSACGPGFQAQNQDLVRFVLNRDEQQLPPRYQFLAYLHHPTASTCIRQSGLTVVMNTDGKQCLFAEIAFPPFGLIMSIDRPPIHQDLCNITRLSQYKFKTWDIVYLKLPVFPVTTWLPGDFRTADQVKRDVDQNRKVGSIFLGDKVPL